MKVLSRERFRVLAEANGWSAEQTRGYVDGEEARLRGETPTKYVMVGIDDYCLGFRTGFYERVSPASAEPGLSDLPVVSR